MRLFVSCLSSPCAKVQHDVCWGSVLKQGGECRASGAKLCRVKSEDVQLCQHLKSSNGAGGAF